MTECAGCARQFGSQESRHVAPHAMASSVADIFALDWVDVTVAAKLMQLDSTWRGSMLRWLTAQRSVVLSDSTDAVLTWVSRKCPNVQSLDISGCRKLTTAAVVDAVRRCLLLKTLIAVGCQSLGYPANGDTLPGWKAIRKVRGDLEVVGRGSRLTIRAMCPFDGSEVWFQIAEYTVLSKLTNVWCDRKGMHPSQVRFCYDGERISPTDTCASLGLEEGDMLEVFPEQTNIGQWEPAPEAPVTQIDRLLLGQVEPEDLQQEAVLAIERTVLRAPGSWSRRASRASSTTAPCVSRKVLDHEQCATLVAWTEEAFREMPSCQLNGYHDFQRQITASQLDRLTGGNTSRALIACAESVLDGQEVEAPYFVLRRHAASAAQLRIPFHCDSSLAVVNLNLTPFCKSCMFVVPPLKIASVLRP